MTWVRVDDQFHAHPKARQAWRADKTCIGLHLLALSYSGCFLTDGRVNEAWVEDQLPKPAERKRALRALIESGLWDADPEGGFWIHDYLKYNESRAQILARRKADSNRKNNGIVVES